MDEAGENRPGERATAKSAGRHATALAVGFLCAVFIWVATPYNNLLIGNRGIGDSYFPAYATFVLLFLVLLVNPLLRRLRPGLALDSRQLAVILGIMLVACVLPGYGILRSWPYGLADLSLVVREDAALARVFEGMNLPAALFPEPLRYGGETPVADALINELPRGASIPWAAWRGPLLSWGALMAALWMMMVGLGVVVFPQWRHNERLAFPVLTVYDEMIRDPEPRRLLPPLFRSRMFWLAAGVVLLLHVLEGAAQYNPERVPAVPLSWNLENLFTEDPWRYLPAFIYRNRLYFAFVGLAYFMPNRISFSIWFFALAYASYQMVCQMYFPAVNVWGSIDDHRMGTMLAITAFVLWLGRAHWAHVARCMVRPFGAGRDPRDAVGGYFFVLGCAGVLAWLIWVGVQPGWALVLLAFAFVVSVVITRIVCETGVPFLRTYNDVFPLMALAPTAWLSTVSIFLGTAWRLLVSIPSRVCVTTMTINALGVEEARGTRRTSLAPILLLVLVCGLLVGGAAHLNMSYHHSISLDGMDQPLNSWGYRLLANTVRTPLLEKVGGQLSRPTYNRAGQVAFGALLAGGLQWACLTFPNWPLHPVGIMLAYISYGERMWFSVLLGWSIKLLLVRYGGARLYHAARPAFLGLILGEIFATIFWSLAPAVLLMAGKPYRILDTLPF